MAKVDLNVNGKAVSVSVDDPDMPLLYVLSEDLQLNGPKFGCGLSECGACTVLMDGQPIRSCTTPLSEVQGAITTIEGLGTADNPHPIQQAFIDEQAIQCGFCISGIMLYGKTVVEADPTLTEAQISEQMSGLLCRCHTHFRMLKALRRYAEGLVQ